MKIRTGGGGVDAKGRTYKLPEKIIYVPDDHFTKIAEGARKLGGQLVFAVNPEVFAIYKKEVARLKRR